MFALFVSMIPSTYVQLVHCVQFEEKTSCRVQIYLISLTQMHQCKTNTHTYAHISLHMKKNLFLSLFLFENKHTNVTNLVINFIYHISTLHSCTPIFYLSLLLCVHAMRRRRLHGISLSPTSLNNLTLFFISFCSFTSFVLKKDDQWHEMC